VRVLDAVIGLKITRDGAGMYWIGDAPSPIILGTYATNDGLTYVSLQNNNRFFVQGLPQISYVPGGYFTVEENMLILMITEDEQFIFSYSGGNLIFESGVWLKNWIEPGTVLRLLAESRETTPPNTNDITRLQARSDNIESITIQAALSGSEESDAKLSRVYTSQEKTSFVVDYLNGLTLYGSGEPFPSPDAAYYLTIRYKDGTIDEYIHFGQIFGIGNANDKIWTRITEDDAKIFIDYVIDNPSD
jgi:hypothetical protein